jgi:hypothetical protein
MKNQTLNEATLLAPVFNGSDEEVVAATQAWSSVISSLTYACGPSYGINGTVAMSAENKRALLVAMQAYLTSKMDEVNNVTVPPVPTPSVPSVPMVPAIPVPTECPTEIEISYEQKEEKKEPVKESISPSLKRMLELARIPHAGNYV